MLNTVFRRKLDRMWTGKDTIFNINVRVSFEGILSEVFNSVLSGKIKTLRMK